MAFEVRDISDASAERELVEMGFMAVPVTVVDGSPPILGADYASIEKALGA